jgi:hypothetical protein
MTIIDKSRLKIAQKKALSMFGRFFTGHQDKLVDSTYDVSQEDIDWVIKYKVEFELKNIAFLLAFEHLRPLFLLWQVGQR